ncbi:unnamed protein product, partial [Choristocarpus tenellus]
MEASGQDPHFHAKTVLVHALKNLEIDLSVFLVEIMHRLGTRPSLQLLWLYERYNVPNAGGGGMTKCQADHLGRDLGKGKINELLAMPEADVETLLCQMREWDFQDREKIFRAWEAFDPPLKMPFLLQLIREEQERGEWEGNLWQCSLCSVKRSLDIKARMSMNEHRREGGGIDAGALYGYSKGCAGGTVLFRSSSESLLQLWVPGGSSTGKEDQEGDGTDNRSIDAHSKVDRKEGKVSAEGHGFEEDCTWKVRRDKELAQNARLLYAGREFDARRLCGMCLSEVQAAVVTARHDQELWHTVDGERRAILTRQREVDLLKAHWIEVQRGQKQARWEKDVSELLHLVCSANLSAFGRRTLERRRAESQEIQAKKEREMEALRRADEEAVKHGARIDLTLRELNVRESKQWSEKLR